MSERDQFEILTEASPEFLAGGGEMGARIRALDWSKTSLGPVESWPQSLRSTTSILLSSRAQIVMFWGPELVALYNDAYAPVFGSKHPWALGKPARECWAEVWDTMLAPLFSGVFNSGEAFYAQDLPFFVERFGYTEETYFDVSYDPVRVETGNVGGIFCIVTETTSKVLSARRMRALRDMATSTADANSIEEVFALAAQCLAGYQSDVPFVLFYAVENGLARLASSSGKLPEYLLGESVPARGALGFLQRVVDTDQVVHIEDLQSRFGTLRCCP